MKSPLAVVMALATALLAFDAAAFAAPGDTSTAAFYGLWRTPVDGGVARLEACGARVCGFIVNSAILHANPDQRDIRNKDPALRGRRVRGLQFFDGRQTGVNELGDGWIYHPIEGNTYSGTVRLMEDGSLRLTGCVIWPLCRTQVWRRIA